MSSVVAVAASSPNTCQGLKFSRTSIPFMQVGPVRSRSSSGTATHFLYCLLQSSMVFSAIFSPVKRVNYKVENTRVENRTDLDKLILGNCYLDKKKQNQDLKKNYSDKFELD